MIKKLIGIIVAVAPAAPVAGEIEVTDSVTVEVVDSIR